MVPRTIVHPTAFVMHGVNGVTVNTYNRIAFLEIGNVENYSLCHNTIVWPFQTTVRLFPVGKGSIVQSA